LPQDGNDKAKKLKEAQQSVPSDEVEVVSRHPSQREPKSASGDQVCDARH